MSNKPKPVECPNNEGVACTRPNQCGTCGWNPTVCTVRSIKILAGMGYVIREVSNG